MSRSSFKLFLALVPFVFFAALEIFLRLAHYGPDLSLFTTENIGSRTYLIMNPDVKSRYFTHVDFSPNTSMDYFAAPKPLGTYRIFVLGGSTTVGFPYGYVGSFSTGLRERLKRIFPDKMVEVINLGMTATNSFTVTDLAHEVVAYEPDLVIVYDGHNEFYGALGAASHEAVGGSRALTRLYLKLVHYRTFQLIRNGFEWAGSLFRGDQSDVRRGTMMERLAKGQYIPYGSASYTHCLEVFKENLQELKQTCTRAGIPLIMGTQVSNLRDLPPFISENVGGISKEQLLFVNDLLRSGERALVEHRFPEAKEFFQRAVTADSIRADLHFRLANCLDSLHEPAEAQREYEQARDLDELRFRASGDFNDAILAMEDSKSVFVADMERLFRGASTDSLIGSSLILEHLHPNERGYFLMAKEYAAVMHRHGLVAPAEEWSRRDTAGDDRLWMERPMTNLDRRCATMRTDLLTSEWPFKEKPTPISSPRPADTLGTIAEGMVKAQTTWEEGHVAAARYFESRGDYQNAEREYRALADQLPVNVSAFLLLGRTFLSEGKTLEARRALEQSLNIERTSYALGALGTIALNDSQPSLAVGYLEEALTVSRSSSERTQTEFHLAVAYMRIGKKDEAVSELRRALEVNPRLEPARTLLNKLQAEQKN